MSNYCFSDRGTVKRGTTKIFFQLIDLNEFQVRTLQGLKDKSNGKYKFVLADVTLHLKTKFYGEFPKRTRMGEVAFNVT